MIRNDEELEVVRQQLGRAEAILVSLKKTVLPTSRAKFDLMSEGCLVMIGRLRSELDSYLGLESAYAVRPYLVVSIEGHGIALGETRFSMVACMLERLHRAFELLSDLSTNGKGLNGQVCDPPLLGIVPGDLRILLGKPYFEDPTGPEATAFRRTIDLLLQGVELTRGSTDSAGNDDMSDELRRAMYGALLNLSPSLEGDIETVRFSGRAVGDRVLPALSKESTRWLKQEIRRLDQAVAQQPPASQPH